VPHRLFLVRTIHDLDGHAVNTFEDQAHDSSLEPAFPPEITGGLLHSMQPPAKTHRMASPAVWAKLSRGH
jgi:hypothetical protein